MGVVPFGVVVVLCVCVFDACVAFLLAYLFFFVFVARV